MVVQSIVYNESLAIKPQFISDVSNGKVISKRVPNNLIQRQHVTKKEVRNDIIENIKRESAISKKVIPTFIEPFGHAEFISRAAELLSNAMVKESKAPKYLNERQKLFYSDREPGIKLHSYLLRLVVHSKWSSSAFISALVLIERLLEVNPKLSLSTLNIHRIIITALMISVKLIDDAVVRPKVFALVGGIPCHDEIIRLEATFLKLVDYRVFVSPCQYSRKLSQLACITVGNYKQ